MKRRNKWERLRNYRELTKLLEKAAIRVESIVYPCEDLDKVNKALDSVIAKESKLKKVGEYSILIRESKDPEDINHIFNLFRKRKVLAAVRKYAKKYSNEKEIIIYLNKQSAFAGVLNICEPGESPLGEIIIHIKCDNASKLLNRLTEF